MSNVDPFDGGFDSVIGRAADLAPDLEPMPKLAKQPVMAVVGLDELKEPSPKPFRGRPDIRIESSGAVHATQGDPAGESNAPFGGNEASKQTVPDYPDLDSLEALYLPKFLLRRWGPTKFFSSAYYRVWKSQAERSTRLGSTDLKPSEQKKKR